MKPELFTNRRVAEIVNQEGIGYAVLHYMSSKDIKDKELKKLWNKAHKALKNLEDFLENFEDDENENVEDNDNLDDEDLGIF